MSDPDEVDPNAPAGLTPWQQREASRRAAGDRDKQREQETANSIFRVGFYVLLKVCMALFLVWLAIQLIGLIVIWVTIAVR